ncbi:polyprenyl synthetase family protein [bacterium SCSIO 12741]|nr:polyprenyl synthetase family protein [bacterium SCSIO 12741]
MHIKYNTNVGILSGDAMMIIAYQYLKKNAEDKAYELLSFFNKTAIEVCEGQQMDMNFEDPNAEVGLEQYLDMIAKKTAVLLGESLRLGAKMAGADETNCQLIYEFGKNFGIAFQLQDDLLDLYGDPEKFGKQIGGDILAGKKTFLYLKALEVASKEEADQLKHWYYNEQSSADEKIEAVKALFDKLDVKGLTTAEMNRFYLKSGMALHSITVEDDRKKILKEYAESLMVREI